MQITHSIAILCEKEVKWQQQQQIAVTVEPQK